MVCMSSTASSWIRVFGLILVCGCARETPTAPAENPPRAAPKDPAGTVEAVEGQVSAMREKSPTRILKLRDPVWADDTVTTPKQASVAIRLLHNGALWELQENQSKRVDQGLAWLAPKQAAGVALADRAEAQATASAGRHSEQEAAQSGEAATRPSPPEAPKPLDLEAVPDRFAKIQLPERKKPPHYQKRESYDFDEDVVEGNLLRPEDKKESDKQAMIRKLTQQQGGGLGVLGSGSGGGGSGDGIGLGNIGTTGHGAGSGSVGKPASETVSGELDRDTVEKLLKRLQPGIRDCYRKALNKDPTLSGALKLQFVVNRQGKLGVAFVGDTFPDELLACITTRVRDLRPEGLRSGTFTTTMQLKAE